jgi:hypothetical protein
MQLMIRWVDKVTSAVEVDQSDHSIGFRRFNAPPTKCRLPVMRVCIPSPPPFCSPIFLARFKAPSMVSSVKTCASGSIVCFQIWRYMVGKSGKGVSGILKVLSVLGNPVNMMGEILHWHLLGNCDLNLPNLDFPSSRSVYVVKITVWSFTPLSERDFARHFNSWTPSRSSEKWLNMRMGRLQH